MLIQFKQDCELMIATNISENGKEVTMEPENFKKDEIHEVDLLDEKKDTMSIQFGDSSVLNGFDKRMFSILSY